MPPVDNWNCFTIPPGFPGENPASLAVAVVAGAGMVYIGAMSKEWESPDEEAARLFKPHYWVLAVVAAVFMAGILALS